jgi:proteasome lid subunit RPN8/RPN11
MDTQPVPMKSALLQSMVSHAIRELPNECCGVLIGRSRNIERIVPMSSAPPAPDAYFMDPEEQIKIYTEMDQRGERFIGIYHSHPAGPPHPSGVDIKLAFHPDAFYFIVSLEDKNNPVVRAFRIEQGEVTEIAIDITE